jgi:SAM-dependent methyltransferase
MTTTPETPLALLCWNCSTPIATLLEATTKTCPHCAEVTTCEAGIWRSLSPATAATYTRFMADYEFIRNAEGRGSNNPTYYLALPDLDITGKLTAQWKIRAETFHHFKQFILAPHADRQNRPLRILDLGAGNGWLSYRLSLLGHQPVAVDLLTNNTDGLAAATNFTSVLPTLFPRVQASVDHLPFADSTFDLVIFNASFHYSDDYVRTLKEALRCTRPTGAVVIADTPWYKHEASGTKMIEEKHASFLNTYGFASDSIHSKEFLTPRRLETMAIALKIKWQIYKPSYGMQWALRPLLAKLKRRRPPSQFRIYVAQP